VTQGPTNILVSNLLRTNELQACFASEHVVDMPLVDAAE
jgi:hypothetical protein